MTPVFTFVELPAPSREDPSTLKVNFLVKIANFARNGFFFLTFFEPPISKVNCLVKLGVFSPYIIFEKVAKSETLLGDGVSSVLEGLKNVKKRNFERKLQI